MRLFYIKAGCLLFWTLWMGIASTTNFMDFMYAFGILPADWRFHSGNYNLIFSVISIYHWPVYILNLMFIGILTYQVFVTILFGAAFLQFSQRKNAKSFVNLAFFCGMGLWAAFTLADEFFIAFGFESTHLGLFLFQLVTLMAIHLLPDD